MKRKLFWILYFGISTAAIVFAAVLLPEYIVFNWYSLFPVGYIIVIILLALFFPSKLNARFAIWYEEQYRIKWGRPLDNPPLPTEDEEWKMMLDYNLTRSKILLLFIPLWLLFIPFFSDKAKIFSFLAAIAPTIAMLSYMAAAAHRANEDYHNLVEKERKEQEQREQFGRWK